MHEPPPAVGRWSSVSTQRFLPVPRLVSFPACLFILGREGDDSRAGRGIF